ncbi:MAG: MFS transporter [Planctomycetaceae bacterium]|nr:MFS transporter [Planctomycetaceae bacterium]
MSDRLPAPSSPRRSSWTAVFAWAMYDWANSAYSTLLITVVLHYVQEIVLPDRRGPAAFAWGIGSAMFAAALLSPLVGAAADANRSKRRWLAVTALGGSAAALGMAAAPPDQPWLVLAAFVAMGLCFELSLVPYNGFLPEITTEATINRVSAFGFALGYLGGAIPLALIWLIVDRGRGAFGLSEAGVDRLGILLLGAWWGAFSLPALWVLRDRQPPPDRRATWTQTWRTAAGQVGRTLVHVRQFPQLMLFLVGFLFYNDGIQTVITQSNTLASKELQFSIHELFALVLAIQLVALPGSLLVGWLSDRVGQKPVLLGCLAVWVALPLTALVVHNKTTFWVLGLALALVLGGTQSVGRAIMGVLTPRRREAEFFGFFNVSGKAASVLGVVQFGAVMMATGNARWAAVSLLVFFLIGGALVWRVDLTEGRRQADP